MAKRKTISLSSVTWLHIDPYSGEISRHRNGRPINVQPTPKPTTRPASQSDAVAKPPKPQSICPECGQQVKSSKLELHRRERCPKRSIQGVTPCPICTADIVTTELDRHTATCTKHHAWQKPKIFAKPIRISTRHAQPATITQRTGVYWDADSFEVLYEGEMIANVGNAKEGWERLRAHEERLKQTKNKS